MKKLLIFCIAFMAIWQNAFAYDFSAVAPSGQTLYYNIVNGNAQVTSPNPSYPYYSTYPMGDLIIPSNVTYNNVSYFVTSIGNYAFYNCSGLTSVTIPNSVTTIHDAAFSECSGLTSVTIPNSVTSIGQDAFFYCSRLTSVTIPNSVTSIGQGAFSCCSLTSVTIPNSVTSIGSSAFSGCRGLTSVTIPNSVTSIGSSAFEFCTGLTSTIYTGTIAQWCNISFGNGTANPVVYSYSLTIGGSEVINLVIPDSVTVIKQYAFSGCTSLTSVIIPNSVTSIGSSAFYGCTSLTSVTIPNSVTSIGSYAFSRCTGLTSVTICNSVTTIGSSAFNGCTGLTSVTIPNSVTSIGNDAFLDCSGLNFTIYTGTIAQWCNISFGNGTANPVFYSNRLAIGGSEVINLVIPNSVTEIKQNAFYGCTSLTSVIIPNSVTSIGYHAFEGCSGLTSVTIPNSVTSIGNDAFSGCTGLTSVTIGNSVASIGGFAFSGCSGLTSVTIPNSVTSIGYDAFSGCSGLTSVTIPNSVTSIGNDAFSGCTGLTSVTIPNSVTYIYSYAFEGCSGLTSVTLGDKNLSVFSNDTTKGEARIELPTGYTSNLWNKTVRAIATAKTVNQFVAWSDGITETPRTITLTENTTLTAIFTLSQYSLNVRASNSNYGSVSGSGTFYYGDTVTVTAYPAEHYHFLRWSDNSTENPHLVVITQNTTLTAYFAIDTHTVNVQSNDLTRGYVTKSGTSFRYGSSCTVTATAFSGYTFACWSNGATDNPYTFAVEQDMDLTAVFVAEGEQVYTVSVLSADQTMGTVSGGGRAIAGSDVVIKAKGKRGYRFVRWNDNNTDSVRTVHVNGNITYTAYFESTSFGIDDVDGAEVMPVVFARDGSIIVHEAKQKDVRVFDMMGCQVAYSATAEEHNIPMPMTGVYLVKVGAYPARKVVVIR